jgi:cation transport ATPase
MGAAGEAMSEHIIFRNVEALEMAGRTDYAVIEQEGSVTDKDLNVTDFVCAEGMSESRLEYIAYALESRKNRPFAKAITRYLRSRKMAVTDIEEFTRLSMILDEVDADMGDLLLVK